MITHKLNLEIFNDVAQLDSIIAFRPLGSKLYRITRIPERYVNSSFHEEITQVLNTLCTIKVKCIWFFNLSYEEMMEDISYSLLHMNIEHYILQTEEYGRDRYGWPIKELLN